MACRTPVVAAPAGAAPELLAAGGGVLLAAADPALMSQAIERVCGLPEPEWRALSEQARAVALRHGWDRSVGLFESALEVAVARQRGAAPPRSAAPEHRPS
jgi:glycosyltransferase involved in cell wall biosynthesis